MVSIDAWWRDGKSPQARAANVGRSDDELVVNSGSDSRRYLLAEVRLDAGIDTLPDMLHLPDGSTLEVADRVGIRRLLGGLPLAERGSHWLQQSWRALLGTLLAALVVCWAAWRYLLPLLAGVLVQWIPVSTEQQLAAHTLQWLQQQELIRPSRFPAARQQALQARLTALLPAGSRYHYQVWLRDAPDIGPNAFALPGGSIVVTDQLLRVVSQPEELDAILAHEAGHVEARHGLRSAVESTGVLAALTLITGDASSLTLALPVALANASYSREHEREADSFAFATLRRHGLSPCLLGYGLQRIERSALSGKEAEAGQHSWFASHPATSDRSQPDGQRCPPLQ
ncbi:M48 family metallopeptidase [Vogesella sp. LIG4]|uniref:M48 family metallopeptidase n=1 Tax=Vogesella sp. LIG4 TaxID=1192162 RepID=UPI00081FC526|nr:M48 family metallopeptidase [Vogesella sp. LIG4]SCK12080.1 Putative Zn-dependent protease [Vogesella sp. LIG4]